MIDLAIISVKKAIKDRDSPEPRIRKAGVRSKSVKARVSLSGETSVLHFFVEGKYVFFYQRHHPCRIYLQKKSTENLV